MIAGHGTRLYSFAESTLFAAINAGDIVINLVDATNFAASGTIYIEDDVITYTGKAVNQLTGVTGITVTHVAATRVVQRIWTSIKSGLAGTYLTSAAMQSYTGSPTVTGTCTPTYVSEWTAVSYDSNSGYTTLTDTTQAWQIGDLIDRKVEVNTNDFPDLEFTIVENGTNYIRVEGDIVGGYTTTTTAIAYTSVVTAVVIADTEVHLSDASAFNATGGTANIEDDIITYTAVAGNDLTGVTGINVGHAVGSICHSAEVTLTSVDGFDINGAVKIGGHTVFYNNKAGNKLLNLSNVPHALNTALTATNLAYKTTVAKNYKISFVTTITRLIDTGASWTDDAYVGKFVYISAGKGKGQQRMITMNKKDHLDVSYAWEDDPDTTSQYKIYPSSDQVLYMGNGTDYLMRFDGSTVTDITAAPIGNILMSYQSRLFVANGFTVYYSDVGDPEYFPAVYTITPPGDDRVTGLGEWNGYGIIFKERSVWKFTFSYNSATSLYDVNLEQIPANAGAISHRTIHKVENVLWYFTGDAVNYLGAAPNQIGVIRTEDISFALYQGLAKISDSFKEKAVAVYDGNTYSMFTVADSDSDYNDYGYEYDTGFTGWVTRTGNNVASIVRHEGVRYYGDSNKGQIYKMDIEDSYVDDTTPVDMIVETKDTDFGAPGIFKTYRFATYGFENEASSVEYITKVYTTAYTLTRENFLEIGFGLGGGSVVGETTPGLGTPGVGTDVPRRVVEKVSIGHSGTRIQHHIRNRQNEKLTITDISTTWYPRSMRHFPTVLIS